MSNANISQLKEWIEVLKNPVAAKLSMDHICLPTDNGYKACVAGEWLIQKHGLRTKYTTLEVFNQIGTFDFLDAISAIFGITKGEAAYICYAESYYCPDAPAFTYQMAIEHIEEVIANYED